MTMTRERTIFTRRHFVALARALLDTKAPTRACEALADACANGSPYFDRARFLAAAKGKPWKAVRYNRCLYTASGTLRECDGCGVDAHGYDGAGGLRRLKKPRKGPSGTLTYVCRRCDPENTSNGSPYP